MLPGKQSWNEKRQIKNTLPRMGSQDNIWYNLKVFNNNEEVAKAQKHVLASEGSDLILSNIYRVAEKRQIPSLLA